MRPYPEVSAPAASPVDRARPAPAGTWTLDPGHSVVAYARRVRRLRATPPAGCTPGASSTSMSSRRPG
jgi:hypothetical protein